MWQFTELCMLGAVEVLLQTWWGFETAGVAVPG
jgi:hypothetical protein